MFIVSPALFKSQMTMVGQGIREKMRKMGTLAGVPIEPPEQTKLLNTCVSQAGVIGGGVPGGTFIYPALVHS
jgi:phosphomevalonate kinase